ncbi:MAG: hypothetical protein COY68_02355 [Candidatus Levybacteria bacterium CG_4_10_14_0_8_um_filter_35_23]|nr:MAG: hypothetical protein COY68_02355 [Candidatus Levybacteria bacterium CG_4_10_14_0_8_um_filter_35_23]
MAVAEKTPIGRNSKIALVSPQINTTGSIFDMGQVGQFESYFHPNKFKRKICTPRLRTLGIPMIHGLLEKQGYNNVVSLDFRYRPNSQPTSEDWKDIYQSDLLGLTAITKTAEQALQVAKIYKEAKPNGIVVMGGYHASARPEEALKAGVDVVVIGEGEKTMAELMQYLESGEKKMDNILGIAYLDKDGQMIITPKRPLMKKYELSSLPSPIFDPMVEKFATYDGLTTSRGCPFDCEFCGVTQFYCGKYTTFTDEAVIRELRHLDDLSKNRKNRRSIFVEDDNFAAMQIRAMRLLGRFDKTGLFPPGSGVQVKKEAGLNPQLNEQFVRSGITSVYVGVESISDKTLEKANKKATREEYERSIKQWREAGLWVHGMFIVGLDGDTKQSFEETKQWAIENVHSAQFFAPVPLPGTTMTKRMQEEGRIITEKWSLYDGHHVLLRPGEEQGFTAWELQKAIVNITDQFYDYKNIGKLILKDKINNPSIPEKQQFAWKLGMLKKSLSLRVYAHWALGNMMKEPGTVAYNLQLQAMEKPQILKGGVVFSSG